MDTPAERAEYALHSARTDLAAAQRLIAQDPAALDPDQLAALEAQARQVLDAIGDVADSLAAAALAA